MTSPLCCIRNTTTTCRFINIITGIVYFLPCNGIDTTKVFVYIFVICKVVRTIIPICTRTSIFIVTETGTVIIIPFVGIFTGFKGQVITSIFPCLTTEGNIETTRFLVIFSYFITIFIVISVFIFTVEEGEAQGCTFAIDPRFQVRNLVVFVFFLTTDFPMNFKFITSTAEVIFTKFNDTHQTIRFGVTCT